MDADIGQERSTSPTVTIQSTAPSTAPSLGDIPSLNFSNVDAVYKAIETAFAKDEDVLALTGVLPEQFLEIQEMRRQRKRKFRVFHLAQENLVIITVPTSKHEKAHAEIYSNIDYAIRQMGLKKNWKVTHATTLSSAHPDGSSREGDSGGGPRPCRMADDAWPTLVIEAGVSQSLRDLQNTIRWWFAASNHQVKIVLIVKIYTHFGQILVEKWTETSAAQRAGATTTRDPPNVLPTCHQEIAINMSDPAIHAASDDPIRANPESYSVEGSDLRLEFELLFLRKPTVGESDIIITSEMFQDLAVQVWHH